MPGPRPSGTASPSSPGMAPVSASLPASGSLRGGERGSAARPPGRSGRSPRRRATTGCAGVTGRRPWGRRRARAQAQRPPPRRAGRGPCVAGRPAGGAARAADPAERGCRPLDRAVRPAGGIRTRVFVLPGPPGAGTRSPCPPRPRPGREARALDHCQRKVPDQRGHEGHGSPHGAVAPVPTQAQPATARRARGPSRAAGGLHPRETQDGQCRGRRPRRRGSRRTSHHWCHDMLGASVRRPARSRRLGAGAPRAEPAPPG